jgi:ornithine carbamoyltransferase
VVRFEQVSSQVARQLVTMARALGRAETGGQHDQSLVGKNIALMVCGASAAAQPFIAAVEQLGAKASQVGADMLAFDDEHELQRVARVLDRLYDAVECQGVPNARVQQLSELATVPVFNGIAGDEHPTARLAEQLDDCGSRADARRWILQAALLLTMS